MNAQKLQVFEQVIRKAHHDSLRNKEACKRLAKKISTTCSLWEPTVFDFLVEMKGLNLKNEDDIVTLIGLADAGIY
jgi:hypothetical protein